MITIPGATSLPSFLDDLLDDCPRAGDGVNPWLYRVARHLHAHMNGEQIFWLLKQKTAFCGRFASECRRSS